ncbi:long-chain-fatty-acid--CoA ligase [Sphingosinicella sp. LY1275]|uniref:class I adenylate-forming enzyme family protein n=1 Tax=Sphingosinicella sp. LY1275 TaxID=3095379 RepID=UPI002ADED599|nr:long-chain-fatty-acid--CoA ligase [Sphingosinicella sp. LY1275]MEA1015348.1 long-chain-fatty-acid--CoA ligase [Sphingosinicella sp. LY1275]
MNTIDDLVRIFAAQTPDAPALTFNGVTQSYAALDGTSNALADGLAKAGVAAGDRIAFIGRNRPEHFELIFAVAKLGAISVGMNWRLNPVELAAQIRDCEPRIIFAARESLDAVEAAVSQVGAPPLIASFDGDDAGGYAHILHSGDPAPRAKVAQPDELCMICYTSGTTGAAKGVTFTHGSLGAIFPGAAKAWGFDRDSINLVCMPTFHTAGTLWGLLALSQGAHDILVADFDPAAIVDLMAQRRVTNSMFAPIMLEQVIAAIEQRPDLTLPDLRTVLYGAAPITEAVLARAVASLGCGLVQGYGLTEINGTITILGAEDHVLEGPGRARLRSAGKAVPWGAVRVVDPETGTDLPVGEVGEVWGRSPGLMRGYWHKPDETKAALTPDGWLRTGDAGYLDADGYLFLTDRIKDMIVTGGENVYPIEVEHVLAAHPQVEAVAVIGVPDRKWGETVKAVVVPRGPAPAPEPLIEWARERLARYKCPTSVDFVAEMPRNASGKILKRVLRDTYWSGHDRRIG